MKPEDLDEFFRRFREGIIKLASLKENELETILKEWFCQPPHTKRCSLFLGSRKRGQIYLTLYLSNLKRQKNAEQIYSPLWKYKSQFDHARMETDFFNETYISDNSGTILRSVQADTEGFTISEVILRDVPPQPPKRQPPFGISKFLYFFDVIANKLLASEYKRKTQRYLSK